jgi:hypothetical protein
MGMTQEFVASLLFGLFFISGAITIVLGSYAIARRLLSADDAHKTSDAAAAVAGRIAALHGLLLALVYAQELDDYKGVRTTLTEESVAIADVYNDIQRYGGPAVTPVQAGLANYLSIVVGKEWDMLGREQKLSDDAWRQWNDVYERLLDLQPATDRQRYLSTRMRDRITTVARYRQMRANSAAGGFSELFWAPALIGLALVSATLYVYRPIRSHLVLLVLFGTYSGLILFFIYAFSNPFMEPGKLQPVPFLQLLQSPISLQLPK